MTTPITRLVQQGAGDNDDTWGLIQGEANELLEKAFGGVVSVAHDNTATLTLSEKDQTVVQGQATDQSRNAVIIVTGATTEDRAVELPDSEKTFIVKNSTTNALTFKAGAGRSVTIPSGASSMIYTDGSTNCDEAINWVQNLRVGDYDGNAIQASVGTTTIQGEDHVQIQADDDVTARTDELIHRDGTGNIFKSFRHSTDGPSVSIGDQDISQVIATKLISIAGDVGADEEVVVKDDEEITVGTNRNAGKIVINSSGSVLTNSKVEIDPSQVGVRRGGLNLITAATASAGMLSFEHVDNRGNKTYLGSITVNDDLNDLVFHNSTGSVTLSRLIQLGGQ